MGTSVLLELHHCQRCQRGSLTATQILKMKVTVDGEPLRLVVVHQGETIEDGNKMWAERVDGIRLFLCQKRRCLRVVEDVGYGLHLDAFLLRAPFVVFVLHLTEGQVGVDIGTHTHLVAHKWRSWWMMYIVNSGVS